MAKKPSKKKLDKWASEAALAALLKYSPEESGLTQLADDARSTYTQAVQQARGAGEGTIAAVDAATPRIQQIYDPTLAKVGQAGTLLSADLSKLTNAADSIKAGAALEAQTQIGNLGAARASTLTDLVQRKVAARQGVQYATENARSQFVTDLTKILKRRQDLAVEKGNFTALTDQQLRDAARAEQTRLDIAAGTNKQSERNSQRSSGIDPDTGKPIPGGELDPETKKGKNHGKVSATGATLLTGGEHRTAAKDLTKATSALETLDPEKDGRKDVAPLLKSGHKSQPVYTTDPTTGKRVQKLTKSGTPVATPEIPQVDELLAGAAMDQYYDGHISRATQKALADAGYSIKKLGLTTLAEYRKKHPGGDSTKRIGTGVKNLGNALGNALGG